MGPGTRKNIGEGSRGTPPPQLIDICGQQVVEQIVARRDRSEHLANRTRG
jgi:hypothetical protein